MLETPLQSPQSAPSTYRVLADWLDAHAAQHPERDAILFGGTHITYLNRPEATAEAFTEDGWLHTGDTAVLREDGNIRFIGRRSEMYKSGGYNVYPREVELALETHEAVVLSAVVSVPDPLYDEVGWAYIVPAPGRHISEKEAADWCKSQLANYKVPKRFIICDELPLLPVGKVDKVKLRAQARERSTATA